MPPELKTRRRAQRALLLIDLVNTWDMAGGSQTLRRAHALLPRIVRLRQSAARAGAPVVYVNDNFGQWRSDFRQVIEHARAAAPRSAAIVDALHPDADDYFILKPRHSGFFSTPLDLLLEDLGATGLVLCGVVGDQCVLATASEALVRKYSVVIPRDTLVCPTPGRTAAALAHFRTAMDIATPLVRHVRWR